MSEPNLFSSANEPEPSFSCRTCGAEYDDESALNVWDSAYCDECYVNDECPDGCDQPHDPPGQMDLPEWHCPTTGQRFIFEGYECDYDSPDRWNPNRWDTPVYLDGPDVYTLEPYEYGYSTCEECCDWYPDDEMRHSDRYGVECPSCYADRRRRRSRRTSCPCGTGAERRFDPVRERYGCATCLPGDGGCASIPVAA